MGLCAVWRIVLAERADLKPWLDQHIVPLLPGPPQLLFHSFLWQTHPDGKLKHMQVWLTAADGEAWAGGVARLLKRPDFYFDFLRDVQLAQLPDGEKRVLFGGDGTPYIGKDGMAACRLFHKFEDGVVATLEIGHRFGKAIDAAHAVKEFFKLFDNANPIDVVRRFQPPFGMA